VRSLRYLGGTTWMSTSWRAEGSAGFKPSQPDPPWHPRAAMPRAMVAWVIRVGGTNGFTVSSFLSGGWMVEVAWPPKLGGDPRSRDREGCGEEYRAAPRRQGPQRKLTAMILDRNNACTHASVM